jgi:nucleotide-binding universal stress UspA family protein
MFGRILIPLDGSPRAEVILDQVARIVKREDSEIMLVRAVRAPLSFNRGEEASTYDREREQAQQYLHDVARRFSGRGAKIHGRVVEGLPAEAILEAAAREGATLIALTTHGRTGIARWMMGSITEKIARSSALPLLIVRSFRSGTQGDLESIPPVEIPFRRILVPVDGSPSSMSVIGPAEKLAQLYNSEILVLHVRPVAFSPSPVLPGMDAGQFLPPLPLRASSDDEVTAKAAERFEQAGLRVARLTVEGDAASEIFDLAREHKADLVALATHGHSGTGRWVLGTVAERILHTLALPILLVRPSP